MNYIAMLLERIKSHNEGSIQGLKGWSVPSLGIVPHLVQRTEIKEKLPCED